MNDEVMDELGPIDYLVVEFPAAKADFSGAMAEKLAGLVEAGTVRVLDLLIITKDEGGEVDAFELHEFDDGDVGALRELGAEFAQLLSEEDVGHIAAALEPGTVAAALVWENSWAAPFAASIRKSGGQLVASGRIPMQAIIAAAEAAADAVESEGA
jgi:fructosamine-3-kinase